MTPVLNRPLDVRVSVVGLDSISFVGLLKKNNNCKLLTLSHVPTGSGSGYILCCTLLEYYAEAWEISKKGCYKGRN